MSSGVRDEDYIKFLQDQGTVNCLFSFQNVAFTKEELMLIYMYSTLC